MFDDRSRIIEMMQELPPFLKLWRLPKRDGMGFDRRPLHQQKILAGYLQTALEFVGKVAVDRRDQGRSLLEGGFKFCFHSGFNMERDGFENHSGVK